MLKSLIEPKKNLKEKGINMENNKGVIDSFYFGRLENSKKAGLILEFGDTEDKFLVLGKNKNILTWIELIAKAFSNDLPIRIKFNRKNIITELEIDEGFDLEV